ncbi:uncharacterized protein GO595_004191 [Histomonas meleagridis]|uniref:uncharacterized protein n=1 Tax=Histomonas meleagridis TaxID=135588 RepID=UPI00355A6D08|nr:hypothetical protein GO595_004191 [Histomonas meleagridis]
MFFNGNHAGVSPATQLPPLESTSFPVNNCQPTMNPIVEENEEPEEPEDSGDPNRSAPYTLRDDLLIFKVVATYYGFGFHGKIPWSFWQTYKRVANSNRSNSSLYHHWNGAMKKKYDAFISNGRLGDCIMWLEAVISSEGVKNTQQPYQPTGQPLFHNRSQPSVPLSQFNIQQPKQPLALVRTSSSFSAADIPNFPQKQMNL